MNGKLGSIFRPKAVEYYLASREKTVLPRFVSPRNLALCWVLLAGLLAAGLGGAYFVQVPVYVSGSATLTRESDRGAAAAVAVVSLPTGQPSELRVGQELRLGSGATDRRVKGSIVAVEPKGLDAGEARKRFGLKGDVATAFTRPGGVAIAEIERGPRSLPGSAFAGGVYPAEIEVGSRRVVSFLPLIDRVSGA